MSSPLFPRGTSIRPIVLRRAVAAAGLFSLLLLGACVTGATDPVQRRAALLAVYPPGKTARADVQARFGPNPPPLAETRPAAGWASSRSPLVAQKALGSERRTGKSPARIERYMAPDGLFSLCYCWFFYDEDDRVVDVEWQYASD